jgi:enamine deaminase RidA (YjgF/YER057c/UK114 family)
MSRFVLPYDPLFKFLYLLPLTLGCHSPANQAVPKPRLRKIGGYLPSFATALDAAVAPYYRAETLENSFSCGGVAMAAREFLPGDARQRERAYSPAVKVKGGTTIYLAGYGAFQDEAGKSYAGDFDGQVRLSFERIRRTLEKAGGKLDDIVTMTFHHRHGQRHRFTQLRKEFSRKENTLPAR